MKPATNAERAAFQRGLHAAAVFPITLPQGQKVTGATVHCDQCGSHIPVADTRYQHHEPVSDTHVIETIGVCRSCRLMTRSMRRVMPDGRLQWQLESGEWVESDFLKARPASWWDLDRRLRRLTRWATRALLRRLR